MLNIIAGSRVHRLIGIGRQPSHQVYHLPELGWGGEMECGIDFHDRRCATHIELDTPLGKFKKSPVLDWS
ncbi:MAG: hypothetical protein QGH58_01970 [Arenicellales bacterium]|nr:hypothetical protein [Arenicellales bacterium]